MFSNWRSPHWQRSGLCELAEHPPQSQETPQARSLNSVISAEIGIAGPCAMAACIKALSEQVESLPLWPFGLDQV
jgi:hypothetical protein